MLLHPLDLRPGRKVYIDRQTGPCPLRHDCQGVPAVTTLKASKPASGVFVKPAGLFDT